MIDEATRRRPECDLAGSVWITLADGQQWAFPRPWVEPMLRGETTYSYGRRTDGLIGAIAECTDDAARLAGAAALAATLLSEQYDLAAHELGALLAFRPSDPTAGAWAKAVIDVATGAAGARFSGGGSAA